MRKIVNIIQKSNQIKNRFVNIMRGGKRENEEHGEHHGHHEEEELDDHNDPHNWSYS